MTVRKAETVYLGDASSVVRAAKIAQDANAAYAAKVKASSEQIIAAQDRVTAAGQKAADAALKQGASASKAAALAGRAALDESKAVGDSTAQQVAAYRAATDAAFRAAQEQATAAKRAADAQMASAAKTREAIASVAATIGGFAKKAAEAFAAFSLGAAYSAVKFQKNMELVHTQAGASTAEVQKMSKAVLALGLTTEQGPNALAKALYPLESVGMRGTTAMQALAAASKGAAVGQSDLTETTHALAGVMVALHEKGSQAAKTMGAIDAVVGVGKMHMQDFVDALSSGIIPTAHAVGLSFNSIGAGLATLTDAGVPAEQAATKMRTILLMLAHEHTKAAVDGLKAVGLTADQLAGAMRKPGNGLLNVLQLLSDHMKGLSKVQKVDLVSSLAGGSRSAGTLITLLDQMDRVKNKYGQITTLSGQFNSRVAAESATASHKIKVAWSEIQVAAIMLGSKILPVVGNILGAIEKFVQEMAKGAGAGGKFKEAIVDSFSFIKTTVGNVITAVNHYLDTHKAEIQSVIQAVNNVKDAMVAVWSGYILPLFKRVLPAMEQIVKGAFTAIEGFVNVLSGLLTLNFGRAWEGVKQIFSGGVNASLGVLRAMTAPGRQAAATIGHLISGAFSDAWGSVKGTVTTMGHWLSGAWRDITGGVSAFGTAVYKGVTNAFVGAINAVLGFVNDIIGVIDVIPGVSIAKVKPLKGLAVGGKIDRPMVMVGEEAPQHPEYVIATNPAYRKRNVELWQSAGHKLGIPGFATGGVPGAVGHGFHGGTANDPVAGAVGKLGSDALGLITKGAGWLLGKLPNPTRLLPGWLKGLGSSLLSHVGSFIKDKVKAFLGPLGGLLGGSSGAGPVPSGSARDWLTKALQITHLLTPGNLSALYGRMMQESGGNPRAINLWDSNAKAGHPSKGLLQTIDSTFASYALPGMGDIWNPIDNAVAAIRYMMSVYGHIVGPSASGYARGGILPFAGSFGSGGTVPGLPGAAALAIVHGGEVITPQPVASKFGPAGPFVYPTDAAIARLTNELNYLQNIASGSAAKAKSLAGEIGKVNKEIGNLTQFKAFKDAIASLRIQIKDMASQAAQAWNAIQQANINAAHDKAIADIQNGPDATQLAAMQAQDQAAQTAAQLSSLNQNITDAQFLVDHSAGQTHVDALAQLQAAQQALTDFQRQQDEQQLQDKINAATKAADATQQTALASLNQQTTDYQNALDKQFGALTDNLAKGKDNYKQWVDDVNKILAGLNLGVSTPALPTDPGTEGNVDNGPGPLGTPATPHYPKKKRIGHRHRVVATASGGQGSYGASVMIEKAYFTGTAAAKAFADRLAFRAAIGTA